MALAKKKGARWTDLGVGVGEHFAEDVDEPLELVGGDDVAGAQQGLKAQQAFLALRPVRAGTGRDHVQDVASGRVPVVAHVPLYTETNKKSNKI